MAQMTCFRVRKKPFGVKIEKLKVLGSLSPKNPKKGGVVGNFPAKCKKCSKSNNFIMDDPISFKFSAFVEIHLVISKILTPEVDIKIQDGGGRHFEIKLKLITRKPFDRF